MGVWVHLTRLSLISLMSGSAFPSSIRSLAEKLIVSASTKVMTSVAVAFFPSASTALVLIVHVFPSCDQAPSPKPPFAWNDQERTFFAAGSHPIHCVPPPTLTFLKVVANVEVMKFCPSDQANEIRATSPPLAESVA